MFKPTKVRGHGRFTSAVKFRAVRFAARNSSSVPADLLRPYCQTISGGEQFSLGRKGSDGHQPPPPFAGKDAFHPRPRSTSPPPHLLPEFVAMQYERWLGQMIMGTRVERVLAREGVWLGLPPEKRFQQRLGMEAVGDTFYRVLSRGSR